MAGVVVSPDRLAGLGLRYLLGSRHADALEIVNDTGGVIPGQQPRADRSPGAGPGANDRPHPWVCRVFGFGAHPFDRNPPLTHLGLDSLMAGELMNRLESELRLSIPMGSVLSGT